MSCDRQLPNIGVKVEESIGVNTKAAKLVKKALPCCKHCMGTAHGVSKGSRGGMSYLLYGKGKGNVF